MEDRILAEAQETGARFEQVSPWRPSGGRRPLRVPLRELKLRDAEDELGGHLELRFRLPPGAYATGVLREILKP
jgi:tRNA(Glu) U13 pseudouridine synthase TruD